MESGRESGSGWVGLLRRHWTKVLASGAAAAGVTVLGMFLLIPVEFEGSAILVIVPPKYSSELKPSALTVQSYQTLLESDMVLSEVKSQLRQEGVLQEGDRLRLGKEVRTKVWISRRAEETSLAPMVQILALGRTGDQAAKISNTWAQVFLRRTRELVGGSTSSTAQFIEEQYPKAREKVIEQEETRLSSANNYQTRIDTLATSWDEKIAAHRQETADQIGHYKIETKKQIEELNGTLNLESRKAELNAMLQVHQALKKEQSELYSRLEETRLQEAAIQGLLAKTPEMLLLKKAITDDALWNLLVKEGGDPDWPALKGRDLATQQLNPAHTDLILRLIQARVILAALLPREEQLSKELGKMSENIREKDVVFRAALVSVEKLTQEREAGQEKLLIDRELKLALLQRDRQREVDTLTRERDIRLAQQDRDIAKLQSHHADLAAKYNQALLARAQMDSEDIRIGAQAVPVDLPVSRGIALGGIAAAVLGSLLAFLGLALRETAV